MGATLPVLSQYFIDDSARLGKSVGLLYGVNTFEAVLGCSLAGFVLIPALGVTWTILGSRNAEVAKKKVGNITSSWNFPVSLMPQTAPVKFREN